MKDIIIATSNMQKLKDFIRVNAEGNYNYNILSMHDYGIDVDINEDGETYQENAYIKAKAVHDMISKDVAVIADDFGYEFEFLDNKPGVYSKRYFGDIPFKYKLQRFLEMMKPAIQLSQRVMNRCGSVVCVTANNVYNSDFKVKGYCSYEVRGLDSKTTYEASYLSEGNIPNSYEYSNIFYLPQYSRVMAELTEDEWYKINPRSSEYIEPTLEDSKELIQDVKQIFKIIGGDSS